MRSKNFVAVSLGLSTLALAACGGGSSPDSAPPAKSSSFSPVVGVTGAGATTDVWWKYRMNGGVAVPMTMDGSSLTVTINDETVRTGGGGTKRSSTFAMSMSVTDGTMAGTVQATADTEQVLNAGPPNAVVSSTLTENEAVSNAGMSARVAIVAKTVPSMALVDFADRTDLDTVAVGHVDEAQVHTTATATATVSAQGMTQTQTESAATDDHETFTIMEQIPSMTVQGKTYQRVVRVDVHTVSTNAETEEVTMATSTSWYAAGVGIIKQEAQTSLLSSVITAELIDSNLSQ